MRSIHFFYRADNPPAAFWAGALKTWVKKVHPKLKLTDTKPELVVALGGDGTILEAARAYQGVGSHILGLNLGTFGFLAAVTDTRDFESTLKQVLAGDYKLVERMMLAATVSRRGKTVFKGSALNDVVVTSPLSIVELEVEIDEHPYQYVRGSGVLVATPTGSTAYNLSAHGPIVTPNIKCMILTEILDHNVPTPSLVVEPSRTIKMAIKDFRPQGQLKTEGQPADVVISLDGSKVFPLMPKDVISIAQSPKHSLFVEVNKYHFFTSLQDKFALK